MKRVEIVKGATRLYYDPETRFLRLDRGGGGLTLQLGDEKEIEALSLALWRSVHPLPK